jgi:NADH dehydrogenase [ubiquinone] 1 alpha subcomplex assembly factor 3
VPLFRGYGDDYLKVNDDIYRSGLLLHAGQVAAPWGPEHLNGLTMEHLQPVLAAPPEVLIIGTGRITCFPSEAVLDALQQAHIGFECMDSRSAARTYNILVTEGRTTSAAMLLPAA